MLTSDYATFVEMQEDLLLRIMDIVEASGTAIGFPTSVTLRAQDSGLDKEKAQAEAVKTWREAGDLPFPNYPPERIAEFQNPPRLPVGRLSGGVASTRGKKVIKVIP